MSVSLGFNVGLKSRDFGFSFRRRFLKILFRNRRLAAKARNVIDDFFIAAQLVDASLRTRDSGG